MTGAELMVLPLTTSPSYPATLHTGLLCPLVHAQLRGAVLWEVLAVHPLGPWEAVLLHHGQVAKPCPLTDAPAGGDVVLF